MPREAQNATPTMRRVPVTKSFGKEVKEGCGNAGGYYRSDPIAMPSARGASRKVAVVGM